MGPSDIKRKKSLLMLLHRQYVENFKQESAFVDVQRVIEKCSRDEKKIAHQSR
jgi:hypothetical protein